MLTNMINLSSFNILDMKESEHDYRFLVESTVLYPSYCPKYGTVVDLYKHGKKTIIFPRANARKTCRDIGQSFIY